MQIKSIYRGARISAFKAREVTREIQGLPVVAALDIQRLGNTLSIVWPLGLTGYVLEASPSLTAPNWQPVSGVNADCANATVPIGPGMRFFRLIRP